MKKILFFCLITALFSVQSFTQNIDSLYTNYFQDTREITYLHLNKTTFLKGEELWFQAYVIEQNTNQLHPTTSNLYVSIFDDLGLQKEQHLIHIKNGIGYANIPVDSTFIKKDYYIKASTQWMRNFNEDHAFTQKISILSDKKSSDNTSLSIDKFYEFKLFPEGGHILANTINNIGILIKDSNNKGVKISNGKIKDETGTLIGIFSTNILGFADANIPIKNNEIYSFEATLPDGTILIEKTTLPEKTGITLNTKILDDGFVLNILTNNKSLKQLNGKKYRMLVHNTRNFKNIFFDFNDTNKTYALILQKKELPYGVNIVTVFDDNNVPIIERLIFNDFEDFSNQIQISSNYKLKNDSIEAVFTNNTKEKIFLSASFLPSETKAYKPDNSIKSQIIFKPYIKGFIENPEYYFKNNYKDLDLLLLTQGWSKYNWDNIFNKAPKNKFNFEIGIDVKIHLNTPLEKKQSILVYSPTNNIVDEILPKNNPHIIENSFLKKYSEFEFSLMKNDNPLKVTPIISYSNSKISDYLNSEYLNIKNKEFETQKHTVYNIDDFFNETEMLDEVTIVGKTKFDNEAKGLTKAFRKLDHEDMIYTGRSLFDFVRPIYLKYYYSKYSLKAIYLNDKVVRNARDLYHVPMEQVREVRMGTVMFGIGREMHVYTYSNKEFFNLKKNTLKIKAPVGFITEKQYYSPRYPSYDNTTFKEYGAVFWKPNLIIEANSSVNLNVPTYFQKEIKVFIEGVSESGDLISKTQLLSIN
ncbi:hypothetical protein [Olleya sp. YS]|uniref:hypothetical protein n=1 Tax=Olleya sp. YS TaxID=3028318 RepID=UPI0024342B35|nr:hypothetical protein [Olleya sp. YS]WGD34744.1 hypothetical protein Ollyesu_13255 [Olleya sp. YS]